MVEEKKLNFWEVPGITASLLWPLVWIALVALLMTVDNSYWVETFSAFPKSFGSLGVPVVLAGLLLPPLVGAIKLIKLQVRHARLLLIAIPLYCGIIAALVSPKVRTLQQLPDSCLNNVKRLSWAMQQYAYYHDGKLPDAERWVDELYPIIKDWHVFKCPADTSPARCSYAMNVRLSGKLIPLDDRVILLFETTTPADNPIGISDDLPSTGRHFDPERGYINWFVFTHGVPDWGNPNPPPGKGHW